MISSVPCAYLLISTSIINLIARVFTLKLVSRYRMMQYIDSDLIMLKTECIDTITILTIDTTILSVVSVSVSVLKCQSIML